LRPPPPSRLPIRFKAFIPSASFAIGLNLGAMIQSVDLSSRCQLLCYLIDPVGIERNMLLDLHNSRKRIFVRPHALTDFFPPAGTL